MSKVFPEYRHCRHAVMQPETCICCKLIATDDRYASLRGPLPLNITPAIERPPILPATTNTIAEKMPLASSCIYRGNPTGETRPCKTCGNKQTKIKLLACSVHGECSVDRQVTSQEGNPIANCRLCKERVPSATVAPSRQVNLSGKKHILYHCWPVRGNGMWERNADALAKRMHLFNGKRIVAIAHNGTSVDDFCGAKKVFSDMGFQVLEAKNNKDKRECQTWHLLWESLKVNDPQANDMVFYGHAKGVSRGPSVWRWTEMMYESLLDYHSLVEEQLRKFAITGSFRKNCNDFAGTKFHYSGGMYWVRSGSALPKVGKINATWYGTESWSGTAFKPDEAGVIFHEGKRFDLYNATYFNKVQHEWTNWKLKNSKSLSVIGS